MRICILYFENSEKAQSVDDFKRDYTRQYGTDLESIDMNTRAGADMAALYDIVRYPAVVALDDQGSLTWLWQEENMPLMNEVRYYQSIV
jgi:hypothetical protein